MGKRRTKIKPRAQASDKRKIRIQQRIPPTLASNNLREPATRAIRGKEKRPAKISWRLTEREHAFAFWLADALGFKTASHLMQTFWSILAWLNDRRLETNADCRLDIEIHMTGLKGASPLLRPALKPNWSKRDVVTRTPTKTGSFIHLRDGRVIHEFITPIGLFWTLVNLENASNS